MHDWYVSVHGDEFDLEYLRAVLTRPECRIERYGCNHYIVCDYLNALDQLSEVRVAAQTLVRCLGGLARLRAASRTPLRATTIQRVSRLDWADCYTETPRRRAYHRPTSVPSAERMKASDPVPIWLALSAANEPVTRALSMYGTVPLTWHSLYAISQIIRDDVGEGTMIAKQWTSSESIDRFHQRAQPARTIGGQLTNRELPFSSGQDEMGPFEAERFIRALLQSWLTSKQPTGRFERRP